MSRRYLRWSIQCRPSARISSEADCARGMLRRYRKACDTANSPTAQIDAQRQPSEWGLQALLADQQPHLHVIVAVVVGDAGRGELHQREQRGEHCKQGERARSKSPVKRDSQPLSDGEEWRLGE